VSAVKTKRPGPVIWLTGLSGAGKSTVATELIQQLHGVGRHPVLLDGDELREVLGATAAYDSDARRNLGLTYGRMCRLLSNQGHTVVCATISLRHEIHTWNRSQLSNYVEVLLDVPLQELQHRDPKGIYTALRGHAQTVGVGIDAQFPLAPDLVITNYGAATASTSATQILDLCASKGVWT
jgi:cytidine diphosphoramidate kinase